MTNERNKLQLENARIPELERRVQVAEEQTKGIQSVASQIALLSQNMQNNRNQNNDSQQRLDELRARFDQCAQQSSQFQNELTACKEQAQSLSITADKLKSDVDRYEAGNKAL